MSSPTSTRSQDPVLRVPIRLPVDEHVRLLEALRAGLVITSFSTPADGEPRTTAGVGDFGHVLLTFDT